MRCTPLASALYHAEHEKRCLFPLWLHSFPWLLSQSPLEHIALCTVNTPRVSLQMTKGTTVPLPKKNQSCPWLCQTWVAVAIHEFDEGGTAVKVWFCQTQSNLLKQSPAFGSCQDPKHAWRLSLVFPLVAESKWNGNPSALEAFSPNASKLSLVRASLHGPNTFLTFFFLVLGSEQSQQQQDSISNTAHNLQNQALGVQGHEFHAQNYTSRGTLKASWEQICEQ